MSATPSTSLWQQFGQKLSIGAALFGVSGLLHTPSAQAVRLSNGQMAFEQPPSLVEANASDSSPDAPATYYFTIEVPENAGEALGAVTIDLHEGIEEISYKTGGIQAFTGDRELTLASIGRMSEDPDAVTVEFDSPVTPGNTVTVALRSKQNPGLGGNYLFGVTAYPAGEQSQGQFLGFGRLRFVDR
ncbi:DUF2808 domain-containing protein [Oscillatoriales cyanobacterium LEGE 11467]|uniref:DUF2808 domain-containing protein n=1 Tax=Zarconia navalis LEGE 11467 TaxID=1828826 RepID=A0A928VWX7_9CYAN|nr:DUF2808 domain-containing protein [Zarconia navalis]MBE9041069.1 DUF2808 domain-containing protein [Zarconia navalis LEGE 11467]